MLLYRHILFTNTTGRYIIVLDVIIVHFSPNVAAAAKLLSNTPACSLLHPFLNSTKSIMTNNNNVNDTAVASTTSVIPPVDRVPHIPLLNANNTRELFRAAFTTNPTALIDEVFLVCNAVYSMQSLIETLRTSQAEIDDLETRLENTLITKSDGDATIARLIAENETLLKIIHSGGASRRTPEHPDPDAFTGEDPSLLPNFLQQLELKLEMNKDWWNSESQYMGYVVSCLKGKAHDQVSYNIKDGVVLFENVNAIKEILKSAFGDIDSQATAQLKIFDMK